MRAAPDPVQGRNVAREYLQARILGSLQQAGAMIPLVFRRGIALRFLFASARYFEDLHFACEQGPAEYDFRAYLQAIRSSYTAEGCQVELEVSDQKTVRANYRCYLAYSG